ncbi:MAG: SDR family oxidoreductase [Pseudomonadota bacterium]|nr:SDR family oxidoreductase [Gammaproteobacteria bacterium]MEC7126162.1 SDR family oxidoreductase [Pseudomonadota bacterium]MEC7549442.1 SDR family oxidoreductase [Pseudomonadota bacterium]MEC7581170.1 SDR family oxidoreductase [Pseudomonadota bacterium]MEC7605825.1 SDR family oxidoreductase [Pseudomonadota bacterium]
MSNRRALITCVDTYMGPTIREKFEANGIEVSSSRDPMRSQEDCEALIERAGEIDILIANLAEPPMPGPVHKIENADWGQLFDTLVHPLMYLIRAVTPQMVARQSGKIIAVTSAAPLKGIPNHAAYCAARGAQNAFIKAVGLELARSEVQVNAIAQNYINNDTYYPDDLIESPKFLDHVKRNVPTNRIGAASETAELAAYLASEKCNHMVGQIIPLAGGWAS